MEDYLDSKIRKDIIKEIRNLDLPKEWDPQQVINYIVIRINKDNVE